MTNDSDHVIIDPPRLLRSLSSARPRTLPPHSLRLPPEISCWQLLSNLKVSLRSFSMAPVPNCLLGRAMPFVSFQEGISPLGRFLNWSSWILGSEISYIRVNNCRIK